MYKCRDIVNKASYPPLLPSPVKDILAVGLYIDMVMMSFYLGWQDTFSKFDTFRSSISDFYTFSKSYAKDVIGGASTGEYPRRKISLTKCTTHIICL